MKAPALVLALLALFVEAGAVETWPAAFVKVASITETLQTPMGTEITVLDARKRRAYLRGHIPGAQHAWWTHYRAGWFRSGRLPDDLDKLARDLAKLGVDDNRPVLVCGSAQNGWGEEGRIAWMINYLGHPAVAILDGGCDAWRKAGRALTDEVRPPKKATFTPHIQDKLRAFTPEVSAALTDETVLLLDVRTREEFNGATPYSASRGGHIPSAVNIPFPLFMNNQGEIRKREAIEALLRSAGALNRRRIIVYCTGGVRSAFATEVLKDMGLDVGNYDASFWAWSTDRNLPVNRSDDQG